LAVTFLRVCGVGEVALLPALDEWLRVFCEQGRVGWPTLDLTDEEFVHHLARVTPTGQALPAANLRAADTNVFEFKDGERVALIGDAFIERGVFTRQQGERVLRAGAKLGMTPRVHADEFSDAGAAALAVEIGAASADHLMHVSEAGIAVLARSNTVANLLPASSFFLMSDRYAPARRLMEAGAIVSLSTDCNPGSSMTESMPIVIQLGTLQMKMTVEEALTAATLNGAFSLGMAAEIGSIEVGKRADLVLLDAPNYLHLVYHFGVNLVRDVLRDGAFVVRDQREA